MYNCYRSIDDSEKQDIFKIKIIHILPAIHPSLKSSSTRMVSPTLRKSSAWSSGRWVLITRTLVNRLNHKSVVNCIFVLLCIAVYSRALESRGSGEGCERTVAATAACFPSKLLGQELLNHLVFRNRMLRVMRILLGNYIGNVHIVFVF